MMHAVNATGAEEDEYNEAAEEAKGAAALPSLVALI